MGELDVVSRSRKQVYEPRFFRKWIESPIGWARSNFIYDTLKEPPALGSPLEAICMYVFNARQRSKFLETILLMTPASSEEQRNHKNTIIDDYMKEMFPYQAQEKAKDSKDISKILDKELSKGPILVQAEK